MNALRSLLSTYPRLSQADLSPVHRWIEEGADLDLDIIPVIRQWTARKNDIYSLGFFARYVREARDARLKAGSAGITPKQRAERIAFKVRRMGQHYPTDERWLAQYEAVHGVVAV